MAIFIPEQTIDTKQLLADLQNDDLWSDGSELERLAGEYWQARWAGEDDKARAIYKSMDDVKPKREKRDQYGTTLYKILCVDPNGSGHIAISLNLGADWTRIQTRQDCWFFGAWYNETERQFLTYSEGDLVFQVAPDEDTFRAELSRTRTWYVENS